MSDQDPAPDTALATTNERRQGDRLDVEHRRQIVGRWRFLEGLTLEQIRLRLEARYGIAITKQMVSVDIGRVRREYQGQFAREFNIAGEFARLVNRYEHMAQRAMRRSAFVKDEAAKVAWQRTAAEANSRIVEMFFEVGLFNKTLPGLLLARPDDGKVVDRVASGVEVQKYFQDANIQEGELVSDAERAYLYGDEAAVKDAEEQA